MNAIVLLQLGLNGVNTGGTCHTIDLEYKRKKKLIVTQRFVLSKPNNALQVTIGLTHKEILKAILY